MDVCFVFGHRLQGHCRWNFDDFDCGCIYFSRANFDIYEDERIENNEDIVELIAVSVPIIISCIVIGLLEKCIVASAILASITYLLYCRLWWYQNRDNKTFDNSSNALGGGIEQFK